MLQMLIKGFGVEECNSLVKKSYMCFQETTQATKEKKHRKVVTFLISSVLGIVLVEVSGPE